MSDAPLLFRDFETRSAADLTRTGAWRYAADPTTEVLCVCFAAGADPVEVWLRSCHSRVNAARWRWRWRRHCRAHSKAPPQPSIFHITRTRPASG